MPDYDVIVIGGGAAGMQAAVSAAARGRRVLLLERNQTLGVKLALTGGGRCNILNAETDTRRLLSHYRAATPFLFSPFSQYGMQDTWDWFTAAGLPLKEEAGKRAFPVSEKASDVVALFVRLLQVYQVTVLTNTRVTAVVAEKDSITKVETDRGSFTALAYILATGGLSHQATGSTGDGHRWLATLGCTVHAANPSLVPLIVTDTWVKNLAGVSLADAAVKFMPTNAPAFTTRGKVLFTHFGLSGPAILNSVSQLRPFLAAGKVSAFINLCPHVAIAAVHELVQRACDEHKNKLVRNLLRQLVPAGMSGAVEAHLSELILTTKVHSLSRTDRIALGQLLQALPCTVTGTKGEDWAVVSDGGIDVAEVDTRTMRVRAFRNLYVVGDILHINRPSGGYSLQLCWTTGTVAGRAV